MKTTKQTIVIAVVAITLPMLISALACERSPNPPETPSHAASAPAAQATSNPSSPDSDGTNEDDISTLPPAIQILSPPYQEAFRLLPNGPWATKYYNIIVFGDFDPEGWSKLSDDEPVFVAQDELGGANEFHLTRILRDEDAQEWLLEKVRELDEASAEAFAAAESEAERLNVFRQMIKIEGIDPTALYTEIVFPWELRVTGQWSEDEIARAIEDQRRDNETWRVLWRLSPKEMRVRLHELRVCELLIWDVVREQDIWSVISDGQCDVAEAVRLSKEALQPGSGKTVPTETEYRERVAVP